MVAIAEHPQAQSRISISNIIMGAIEFLLHFVLIQANDILLLRSGGCDRRPSSSMVKSEFFPLLLLGVLRACHAW
jgi:hypothetical protein